MDSIFPLLPKSEISNFTPSSVHGVQRGMVLVDNMSKINLLRTKMALFLFTEKLEVDLSMFIRSDISCHLAHDVKKSIIN